MPKIPGVSMSCAASVGTAAYLVLAVMNLYRLMNPLYGIDLEVAFPPATTPYATPLWSHAEDSTRISKEGKIGIRVYLSREEQFTLDFLDDEQRAVFSDEVEEKTKAAPPSTVLLWESDSIERAFAPTVTKNGEEEAVTKSFILTTKQHYDESNGTCSLSEEMLAPHTGKGFTSASTNKGSVSDAIGSSSFILQAVDFASAQMKKVVNLVSGIADDTKEDQVMEPSNPDLAPVVVKVDETGPIWQSIMTNETVHLHVLLTRQTETASPSSLYATSATAMEKKQTLQILHRAHSLLMGEVPLVKHDEPLPKKPTRILIHDLTYLIQKYVLNNLSHEDVPPPWVVLTPLQVEAQLKAAEAAEVSLSSDHHLHEEQRKLLDHSNYRQAVEDKQEHVGYPYWKPEVAIKLVTDDATYPADLAAHTGLEVVPTSRNQQGRVQTYGYLPPLFVDEIGLTSDKYIPLNKTVTDVPLHITLESLSPQRYRLISHLSSSLESQRSMGFEQSDIDDVRRLISDTNVTLLAITILASVLHLLFELLTFKSEVEFWQQNEDLTGLSVRALFVDTACQLVILAFLVESESSLLMTVPAGIGILVAMWKCQRAARFRLVRGGLLGWTVEASRLKGKRAEAANKKKEADVAKGNGEKNATKDDNTAGVHDLDMLSLEMDRKAFGSLGKFLFPGVGAFALHSLVTEEHSGWYSWFITTASGSVYALGFVLMTPQLFMNYKLKSVAHLPWKVLCYKFLNTFIDDLFAFIIRMPTMARISCFRDDVVFIIYLVQRFIYPVDKSRPVEGASGSSGGGQ
jgi:hypothetical protein